MKKICPLFLVLFSIASLLTAQDQNPADKPNKNSAPGALSSVAVEQRNAQFTQLLNNVKLIGQFTILGKGNGPMAKEEYTILKVDKLADGDKWMFHCRIKYGSHDLSLPLPLDVKWAGETPVITLTDLTIPTLGTFSARVVLHDDKYAGTWRHDRVSGHLFGTIEKVAEEKKPADSSAGTK